MTIITPGHRYELLNFNQPNTLGQTLQFIEKVLDTDSQEPGDLRTVNDGTTNEEVLAVLIDRLNFLQAKFPCRENAIVITKLQESLFWLQYRTEQRKLRGVEG